MQPMANPMQQTWSSYTPQMQQAWGSAGSYSAQGGYPVLPQEEEPPPAPIGQEGYVRLSRRIFVVPDGTTTAAAVEELNDVHSVGVVEKGAVHLDPAGWEDESELASAVNKAFRVKGGKPGPKFWKGVREAVMKMCTTQDVLLFVTAVAAAEQVQALVKNLLGAADTKAAADQLVGLKSGKVVAVLVGWDAEDVGAWPVVSDDPIPAPPSREELARRQDPDDLSQYYAQSSRQAQVPPRQVPPRQRQQFAALQQGRYGGPMNHYRQQYGRDEMGSYGQYDQHGYQQQYGDEASYGTQGGYPQDSMLPASYGGGHQQQQGMPGGQHRMNGFGGGSSIYDQQQASPFHHQQQHYGNGIVGGHHGSRHSMGNGGGYGGYGGSSMHSQGSYGGGGSSGFGGGGSSMGLRATGGAPSMSMRAADERAAAELLWSAQMQGGSINGNSSSAFGGEVPAASDFHSSPGLAAAAAAAAAQFGMSPNAPSFMPGGNSSVSSRGPSLEQESLREASENLWGCTGGGGSASAAAAPSQQHAAPRFTVPAMDRVPSLQAMEAESMRAAAAGLWGQTAAAPVPAMHPSLGVPSPAPMLPMMGALPLAPGGADPLCGGLDVLASLRLDSDVR